MFCRRVAFRGHSGDSSTGGSNYYVEKAECLRRIEKDNLDKVVDHVDLHSVVFGSPRIVLKPVRKRLTFITSLSHSGSLSHTPNRTDNGN